MDPATFDLLRLTLTPGVGPILLSRIVAAFGSGEAACRASQAALERIEGIGAVKARSIAKGLAQSQAAAESESALAERLGVTFLVRGSPAYPALLAELPDSPPLLYCRGEIRPGDLDRYPLAIVGSRGCTSYGLEQARRFASVLARAGLTIISGGARGIDSAAHHGALEAQGRTIAVMGCG